MAEFPITKSASFALKADLEHRIVSLTFQDRNGDGSEIWLSRGNIFLLLDEIAKLLQENPEMEQWKAKFRSS